MLPPPIRDLAPNPVLSIARQSFIVTGISGWQHNHPDLDALGSTAIACDNVGVRQSNNELACSGCPGSLLLLGVTAGN